jgi:hypothetical protein
VATDAQGDGITALTQSPRLTQRLWQVVRAKRRFFTARALVLASLACLLLAAVIIGADIVFAFGPAGRWLTFVLVVLAMLLILTVRLVLPWRRYHEHQAVRDLESACAGVGQLLRTSAEIAREGDAKAFSPALSRALIRQAEETLATAPMARVIPWPTLRRWGLALAALALAFALAVLLWPDFRRGAIRLALPAAQVTFTHLDVAVSPAAFERGQTVRVDARLSGRPTAGVGLDLRLPRSGWVVTPMTQASDGTWSAEFAGLTQSFEIRLRAGDARCRQRIRFIDPPAVQSAAVQVDYPAYTRLPATQGPLQDLRLPEGAKARFTFALNHPLTHAAVILPDGKRQALETGGAALVWEWTATPGLQAFSLAGEDAEGLPLKAFGWEVRGTPDQRPQVTLLEPAEDISLTPIGETPIVARIQDDFGIAQAEIILTVDGKEQRLAGQEPAEAPRQLRLTHDLRLEDLALAPGSSVRLHARARDLLPERPGWSVSDIRVITIRPLKILRRPGEPKPPESGRKEDELKQDIATLQQAIERQKDAVQETLQRREEQPDSRQPLPETAAAERELAQVVNDLADRAAAAAPPPPAATPATPATPPPSAPAPALEQAEQQLQAAAEALTKPDLNTALRREDQALSAMVQARDLLQQQLEEQQAAAAQQPNAPQAAQAQPPPTETLEQLAERAEALARTEQAVRNAVAPTPAPAPANPPPAGAPPPAPDAPAQPVPTPADAPPAAPAQDQVAQTAPPPAAQAPALPPPAPTPAPATPQQQAAVQQAEELAADIRQNPRTTTLASQRMAAAGETMDKALRDLRAADPQAAAQELAQAQEQLETIATHLRGLDPARAAETLERAARLAEEAARQLSPPPADPAADPATDPATAATVPPTPAPAEPAATPPDAPASEQVARTAETVDDWLKRLATEPAKDPEAIQNPLRELRRTLRTDSLADQVAQAAQDRQEGRTEQARQAEQDAAERFEQMAKGLTQERQRLVRGRLEQLAAAEATAKALQNELNGAEKPAPTEAKDTAAKLREFAGQLQDLRDTPLDRAARELRDQVPPPNQPGPAPQGGKIPERVRQEVLPGAVVRLRTLIDEMVQRELLVDRDARIPEQYNGLVESYFKAISDEQK